jgi:glycosyltransferase involved in cell wall biosynthesis
MGGLDAIFRLTPIRFSRAWQSYIGSAAFDRAVAPRLPPARVLVCFAGSAMASFRRARELGYEQLHLESASAHVVHARRMYDQAARRHPIEADWLHPRLIRRILQEYAAADVIWVNSEYSRETFLQEGVPASKLRRRFLPVDKRFTPCFTASPAHDGLHAVYVGSLCVTKGVPVLLDAFARLADPKARLTLVGGYGSRGMRKYLHAALRNDPRIAIVSGDPLAYLRQADVLVHPSYSDGFGLAPMEALASGLPVIVTEDTGMKEHVREGLNGYIVPTGRWEPILARLEHIANSKARPDSRDKAPAPLAVSQ